MDDSAITGAVVRVDRFGNLITNIDHRTFDQFSRGAAIAVTIDGHEVPRIVPTYADSGAGEICALFGSTDHLEIAVNAGSAASLLGLSRGAAVVVRREEVLDSEVPTMSRGSRTPLNPEPRNRRSSLSDPHGCA